MDSVERAWCGVSVDSGHLELGPQLPLTGVLEGHDAGVSEDDPAHGDGFQAVDGGDGVGSDALVTDSRNVPPQRECQEDLQPDIC